MKLRSALALSSTFVFCTAAFVVWLPYRADAASLRAYGKVIVPPVTCPQGGGAADNGCSTSPGGSLTVSNFFDGFTGTDYPSRPSFNVPCVDYACGMPVTANPSYSYTVRNVTINGSCGTATMVDPALASTGANNNPGCGILPAACAYADDGNGFPAITCANTSNDIILKGFDLGAVGGHSGTYIQINSTVTGDVVLAFNNFVGSTSTYVRSGWANWAVQGQGDIILFANNFYGNWETTWSGQGAGTASQSGTTLTVSACSSCQFAVGQYTTGGALSGQAIFAQLSGTPGGVGTYKMSQSRTQASTSVNTWFQFGGIACNTAGSVVTMYNLFYQTNGRPGTCSMRGGSQVPAAIPETSLLYNFAYGGVYTSGPHYEFFEYVNQNGSIPLQFDLVRNIGNVVYFPAAVNASSVTGAFFISTGEFNSDQPADYTLTYDVVETKNNVIAAINGAEGAAALDSIGGAVNYGGAGKWPAHTNSYTATDNWVHKDATGYYSLCNGNQDGVTSFWRGSQSGTTLTVVTWQGGDTIKDNTRVFESGVKILSQLTNTNGSGTPGKEGTYLMASTCSVSCTTANRRSAPENISAVTASGNTDLLTGSAITLPVYLSAGTNLSSCTYPGMR